MDFHKGYCALRERLANLYEDLGHDQAEAERKILELETAVGCEGIVDRLAEAATPEPVRVAEQLPEDPVLRIGYLPGGEGDFAGRLKPIKFGLPGIFVAALELLSHRREKVTKLAKRIYARDNEGSVYPFFGSYKTMICREGFFGWSEIRGHECGVRFCLSEKYRADGYPESLQNYIEGCFLRDQISCEVELFRYVIPIEESVESGEIWAIRPQGISELISGEVGANNQRVAEYLLESGAEVVAVANLRRRLIAEKLAKKLNPF